MTWYVHINRGKIDGNRKHGREEAPIAVKQGRYGHSMYGSRVDIRSGCIIRYDAAGILPCGARVVIETEVEAVVT